MLITKAACTSRQVSTVDGGISVRDVGVGGSCLREIHVGFGGGRNARRIGGVRGGLQHDGKVLAHLE